MNLINIDKNIGIGLSGKDANLLVASKLFSNSQNLVGKIDFVNTDLLNLLLDQSYIPVIASVASSLDAKTYNVNADTAASSIAQALNADKLILLTDTPGVLLDIKDPNSLQKKLSINDIEALYSKGIISGGMMPKVQCWIDALRNKVETTHIIDGRTEHALLFELLTKSRIGSQIILWFEVCLF